MVSKELINESGLFKIFYDSSNPESNVGIFNSSNKVITYYVIDVYENYNVYGTNESIDPNSWILSFPREKYKNCKYVYIYIESCGNHYVYKYDLDNVDYIERINFNLDFNYSLRNAIDEK